MRYARAAIAKLVPPAAAVGVCMLALHPAAWLVPVAIALAVGVTALSGAVAWKAYRHHRFTQRLCSMAHPAVVDDVEIQELAGVAGAFVGGLRRPHIFCSPQLRRQLEADELRAVLLHERYHQLDRAPAKLVVLEALSLALRPIGFGRAWLARRIAVLEIAADRHAISHGSSRGALARALLKLAPAESTSPAIAFTSAVDLRLRALVDGQHPERRPLSLTWLVAPVVAVMVCALVVVAG